MLSQELFPFTLILTLNPTAQQRGQYMASTNRVRKGWQLDRNKTELVLETDSEDYDKITVETDMEEVDLTEQP